MIRSLRNKTTSQLRPVYNSPVGGLNSKTPLCTVANKRAMGIDALLEKQVGHLPKFHIYTCTPFLPQGSKLTLFSLYEPRFLRYGPIFTLPYLTMKPGHWPKCQMLHILLYSLSTLVVKIELVSLYGQWFPRYVSIFKTAIFGHETWSLPNVPEVAHTSLYPRGLNLSLFHSTGSGFQDMD